MAILFTEGFDSYNTTTGLNLLTRWTSSSLPNNFSTTRTPFNYGKSYFLSATTSVFCVSPTFTATPTITLGCNVYLTTLTNTTTAWALFEFISSGTSQGWLHVMNDGTVQYSRGNNVAIARSTTLRKFKVATWQYIELSVSISDTVGTVRVDLDGETILNVSNLDTRNGVPTTVDQVRIGSNNGDFPYFDDLYVSDSITPLGPQRIYTLKPTADTAQKQWLPLSGTDNFAMVDDSPIDGDATYVSGSAIGDFDLYDLENYTPVTATVNAVNQLVWARKTDATTRTMNLTTKSGSTTTDSAAITLLTSYAGYSRIYNTDPNTSAAWTISGINALQIGQKVAS